MFDLRPFLTERRRPFFFESIRVTRSVLVFIFAILAGLGAALWLNFEAGVNREAAFMGGIFVLATILWLTEAIPLYATSLLIIGLEIILLANPGGWSFIGFEEGGGPGYKDIIALAADPILLLFFGGFLLARAAMNEGVDETLSSIFLKPFGRRPYKMLFGVMSVTACFSLWMSNTAATAMMLALIGPILAGLPPEDKFRKALVLGIPFGANLGGLATPIGSPPNAVAISFLADIGHPISFLTWMLMTIPLVIVLILFAWQVLARVFPCSLESVPEVKSEKKMTWRSNLVVVVFSITALLWMTDQFHGLPGAVVALFPAIILSVTGVITRNDLNQLEWNILILISGGIVLGTGLSLSGLDDVIVSWLPMDQGFSVITIGVGLVVLTAVLATFMSNTAAANLMVPLGVSSIKAFGGIGGDFIWMAASIALASALPMILPISTPPNAIAYGTGEIKTWHMASVGGLIGLVGITLVLVGGRFALSLFGMME